MSTNLRYTKNSPASLEELEVALKNFAQVPKKDLTEVLQLLTDRLPNRAEIAVGDNNDRHWHAERGAQFEPLSEEFSDLFIGKDGEVYVIAR